MLLVPISTAASAVVASNIAAIVMESFYPTFLLSFMVVELLFVVASTISIVAIVMESFLPTILQSLLVTLLDLLQFNAATTAFKLYVACFTSELG